MDIRLLRRPLPHSAVRASGIAPTDRYLEWCWGPVVGPSTTALVRRAAELTADSGEARLPLSDLSRLLGLGSAEAPTRNNRLVHTLDRVERYGLAFTSVGIPGELVTFWIHDQITVVPRAYWTASPRSPSRSTPSRWRGSTRRCGPRASRPCGTSSPTSDRRLWGFGRRTTAGRRLQGP
jgi:hypothetical protein